MDPTIQQWRFKEGDEVYSVDDEKLGKVVRFVPDMTSPTHLVVEKGLLVKRSFMVPISAVTHYEGDTIYLSLTKDAAEHAGRGAVPGAADASTSGDQPW
ncbi:MAG: DUF2171 domain-containing protein [Dactylosporangium sp.]|nr:DUF2171 domain-containing protein [Dactylosporangium sp.]